MDYKFNIFVDMNISQHAQSFNVEKILQQMIIHSLTDYNSKTY